jgi:hypothetical protein
LMWAVSSATTLRVLEFTCWIVSEFLVAATFSS